MKFISLIHFVCFILVLNIGLAGANNLPTTIGNDCNPLASLIKGSTGADNASIALKKAIIMRDLKGKSNNYWDIHEKISNMFGLEIFKRGRGINLALVVYLHKKRWQKGVRKMLLLLKKKYSILLKI